MPRSLHSLGTSTLVDCSIPAAPLADAQPVTTQGPQAQLLVHVVEAMVRLLKSQAGRSGQPPVARQQGDPRLP